MKLSASPAHSTRRSSIAWTAEHTLLLLIALLLLALLNLAYLADILTLPSISSLSNATIATPTPTTTTTITSTVEDSAETALVIDANDPSRRGVRVGMAMPARGPPHFRPGCAFMAPHHLEDRFVRDDACFSRDQIAQIIEQLVVDAAQLFGANNITYFLESGSLLGAYRHQGVIPHDFDGDLAIDAAGFEFLRTNKLAFDDDTYQLDVWNSPFYENAGRDDKLSARLIHKASALYADVFVFHDRAESNRTHQKMVGPVASDCYWNCVHCPRLKDGRSQLLVPREWIYPLQDCLFGGHTLKCPAKTVEYLTHQYGDDFMVPA